jgi:hypothetical protein
MAMLVVGEDYFFALLTLIFLYSISSNLARSWRDDMTGMARMSYALTAAVCLNS